MKNSNNLLRTKFMDIDLDNVSINGKRFPDWDEKNQEAFFDGLIGNNTISKTKSTGNSTNSSKNSSKNWTDKFNIGNPDKDKGHWVTLDNGKHLFIKDDKSNHSKNTSHDVKTQTTKTKNQTQNQTQNPINNKKEDIKKEATNQKTIQRETTSNANKKGTITGGAAAIRKDENNSEIISQGGISYDEYQEDNKQNKKAVNTDTDNKKQNTSIQNNKLSNAPQNKTAPKNDSEIKKELSRKGYIILNADPDFESGVKKWEDRIRKNKIFPTAGKLGATYHYAYDEKKFMPDATGMMNIAAEKYLPLYELNAEIIDNIDDPKLNNFDKKGKGTGISIWKPYMKNKIQKQFEAFNYNMNEIKGHIFANNSAPVKRIKKSGEFKNIILKNKDKLISGGKFSGGFKEDENLYNAFGLVDFLSGGIDNEGNLYLYMFDTYDFNPSETNPAVEAGRRQMLAGTIKGFFSIHEIILTKEEQEEYGL